MRPLTPFASYHDNAGHLLVGRVRFCNPDSSPAEVFTRSGTTLGSSVFTDSSGRLVSQPYLYDHDYLMFFDKYIGHATMTEDEDEDSWEEQGSSFDNYNTIGVDTTNATVKTVATIEGLRHTLPTTATEFDGKRFVTLLGYETAGDKPAINYVWDPESTEDDDGGSVIKVNAMYTGRWVLAECPRYLDVRHFGAFPSSSSSAYPEQRYAVNNAGLYAHANNCGLYFGANETAVYYDISGLTLFDVESHGAELFAVDGTSSVISDAKEVRIGGSSSGSVAISGKKLYASWAEGYPNVTFSPSEVMVLDATVSQTAFSNVRVEVLVTTSGKTFTNCELISDGKLGANTFRSCKLTGSMFLSTGQITPDVDDSVSIDVDDFVDTGLFLRMWNQQSYTVLDMHEKYVSRSWVTKDNVYWKNAVFNNATYSPVNSTTFDNCKGSIELGIVGSPVVSSFGSQLNIVWTDGALPALDLHDTQFNLQGHNATAFSLTCDNCRIGHAESIGISMGNNVHLEDTVVECNITCGGSFYADSCVFSGTALIQTSTLPLISLSLTDNMFKGTVTLNSLVSGTVVNGIIKNNHSTAQNAIVLHRDNIDPVDAHHAYVYTGNTGTFLPDVTRPIVVNVTVKTDHYTNMVPGSAKAKTVGNYELIRILEGGYAGVFNGLSGSLPFAAANFFRIGTDPFRVKMVIDAENALYNNNIPVSQMLKATFAQGYAWNIGCWITGEWEPYDQYGHLSYGNFPSAYQTVTLGALPVESGDLPADVTLPMTIHFENVDRHE